MNRRPKLLFVEGTMGRTAEYFMVSAINPIRQWLAMHFDLSVVESLDPDPEKCLETHAPDLVLFLGIATGLASDISKLGDPKQLFGDIPVAVYSVMDAHSPGKSRFFWQVQQIAAKAVFTMDTGMREIAGEFSDLIYYCPWFLNESICRDYQQAKVIPISMIGDGFDYDVNDFRYPWRKAVAGVLRPRFPTFFAPRPDKESGFRMVGESYGQMINRSMMALGCGGSRQIFMKKHLEIPGCRTCLITEENPTLLDMGFRDMENCVFVSAESAVEKCEMLLSDSELLERITNAGFEFVHSHHNAARRDVILQWYQLWMASAGEGAISQQSLMMPLVHHAGPGNPHLLKLSSRSPYISSLSHGFDQIESAQDPKDLSSAFDPLGKFLPGTPESGFYPALASLVCGDFPTAYRGFESVLEEAHFWETSVPDPILWACFLIAGSHAISDSEQFPHMADAFPQLDHPFLNQVREQLGSNPPMAGVRQSKSYFSLPEKPDLINLCRTPQQHAPATGD